MRVTGKSCVLTPWTPTKPTLVPDTEVELTSRSGDSSALARQWYCRNCRSISAPCRVGPRERRTACRSGAWIPRVHDREHLGEVGVAQRPHDQRPARDPEGERRPQLGRGRPCDERHRPCAHRQTRFRWVRSNHGRSGATAPSTTRMGEVQVPREALWRAQTQRAVENFPISGTPIEPALIHAIGEVKAAAAKVNGELGVLDARAGGRPSRPPPGRSPPASTTTRSRSTSSRPAPGPAPT